MFALKQKIVFMLAAWTALILSAEAQESITSIRFNDGTAGAVINLGAGTSGSFTSVNGVLSIDVAGVSFRVKCPVINDVASGECVVYAGGADSAPDSDNDGLPDPEDSCDNTPADEIEFIDASGCSPTERDTDGDGYNDAVDFCDNTPAAEISLVDANGCAPSEQTSTAGYCDNTPSTYICNPSENFDDFISDIKDSKTVVLNARQARSFPFTLPAGSTATGEFFYANNESMIAGFTWRAWFSTTPGGKALTTGGYCTFSSTDPNGKGRDWSQVSANAFNCYLGQEEQLLYLNFGIFDVSGALTYPRNYNFQVDKNVFSK